MLFPIGGDNSDLNSFPLINYLLIAANIIVYVLFQGFGQNDAFTYAFAAVPKEILTGIDIATPQIVRDAMGNRGIIPLQPTPIPLYGTIITSMFMHGSFMHLLGNMFYLLIFGDNLEDRLGHFRYLTFYLLCGAIAAFAQIFSSPGSIIPMIGASGAISGVLGGYLLLFPRRRVLVIMFYLITHVPAILALGIWIVFQVLESLMKPAGTGGVAYMAHIGGFIAGFLFIKIFALGTRAANTLNRF